jgi:hypothetical protein
MNRVRNICRLIFFVVAIVLLVYINRKTKDDVVSVAEFKFKMYQKISKDSLDANAKLNLVLNETSKFIDDSSHVRRGVNYLTGLFVLLIIAEFTFLMVSKSNYRRSEN